jgi:hypothetical protein
LQTTCNVHEHWANPILKNKTETRDDDEITHDVAHGVPKARITKKHV